MSDWIEVQFDELYSWYTEWADRIQEGWKEIKQVSLDETSQHIGPMDTFIAAQEAPKALNTAVQMIRDAIDGEKHYKLLNAANLLGGYVAVSALDEDIARETLRDEIENKPNVADLKLAYRTIEKGLAYRAGRPFTAEKILTDQIEYAQRMNDSAVAVPNGVGRS